MTRPPRSAWLLAGLVAIVVVTVLVPARRPPAGVEAASGVTGAAPAPVAAWPGVVEPKSEAIRIGAAVDGTLARVLVDEGDRVTAGQVLAEIAHDDYVPRVASAEATLIARQADARRVENGLIETFHTIAGPGVRVDSVAHSACVVSHHYDSMIAKVIAHGRDRAEAIARMRRALQMLVIEGIKTSIALQLRIVDDPDFVAGRTSTSFLEDFLHGRSPEIAQTA